MIKSLSQKSTLGLIVFCFVAHLWAGVFSAGFYDLDEQYQVLEYVGLKMGRTTKADLTWEFHKQIRPWFQPAVFTGVAKVFAAFGITDAFTWALSFRELSALLGLVSVLLGIWIAQSYFTGPALYSFISLSTLIWFFPFLHARSSSENWSGTFFFIGAVLFAAPHLRTKLSFLAGLCLGFAFESRYQMGISVASLFFWGIVIERKKHFRTWSFIVGGLATALAVGTLCDRWGYGNWGVPAWHYLKLNLIEGEAARQGVSPFFNYFSELMRRLSVPVGAVFIVAALLTWVTRWRGWITWMTLPFVLVHSFIAHKEFRFLFPLINAVPFFLTYLWAIIPAKLKFRGFVTTIGALNLLAVVIVTTVPARPELAIYRPIAKIPERQIFYTDLNPFTPRNIPLNFFRPPGLVATEIKSLDRIENRFWLFDQHGDKKTPEQILERCRLTYSTFPHWVPERLTEVIKGRGLAIWNLYECRAKI